MSKSLLNKKYALIRKKSQAISNAKRQRRQLLRGKDIRVRPEFWEQVARDYSREITEIETRINPHI